MYMNETLKGLYKFFLILPIFKRYSRLWYKKLGVNGDDYYYLASDIKLMGDYSLLHMAKGSVIRDGSFLLIKNIIKIGENSTIAYQCTLLTSANPNGPLNKLSKIYNKVCKPIIIGENTWIGARTTILPGVTIGNYCVVAAGSVVNRDVPDYTVVAGVPAKKVKQLDPEIFED
ncbi:MAG: acyltransferase [Clostridiaceae bacterium]|nr:acyltransferase [Clostridiaceae bacterium]